MTRPGRRPRWRRSAARGGCARPEPAPRPAPAPGGAPGWGPTTRGRRQSPRRRRRTPARRPATSTTQVSRSSARASATAGACPRTRSESRWASGVGRVAVAGGVGTSPPGGDQRAAALRPGAVEQLRRRRRGRRRAPRAAGRRAPPRAPARSPASTSSSSASAEAPPGASAWPRRNWLTAASSPPTRAASRRAASTARSASRTRARACSTSSSACSRATASAVSISAARASTTSPAATSCCSSSASWRASSASRSRSSAASSSSSAGDPGRRAVVGDVGGGARRRACRAGRGFGLAARRSRPRCAGPIRPGSRPGRRRTGPRSCGATAPPAGRCAAASASSAASRRLADLLRARARAARRARGPARPRSSASVSARRRVRRSSRASSQRASSVWRSRRACSSAASAWRLSGRSRERASRSTSSARSRLSCVRPSFSCARRRRLRCLPRPGRLLDQQPAVARLGGDDRLDPALRDDRVHLLAQAGVRQHLDHVDQPAAGASQPILALAGAIEPPHGSRPRARPGPATPSLSSSTSSTSAALAGLAAGRAAEDHVLHRLAAHRHRRLLPERPQHGVGDVRLARAVGPDDHAHAGPELEPGAVGERLEALQRDRLQVHARTPRIISQRLQRRLRGLLLGVLLAAPGPAPDLDARRSWR